MKDVILLLFLIRTILPTLPQIPGVLAHTPTLAKFSKQVGRVASLRNFIQNGVIALHGSPFEGHNNNSFPNRQRLAEYDSFV
jgi:hypothetical protein